MGNFLIELYNGRTIFGQASEKTMFIETFIKSEKYFKTSKSDIKYCIKIPSIFRDIARSEL